MAHKVGQQHPITLYLVVWGWLFILSTCSFLVDYLGVEGYLRWFLILLFMVVKAGLIVAVFMHMAWERLALMYAILAPPGAVLVFVAIMAFEADYTHYTRVAFFGTGEASTEVAALEPQTPGSGTGTAPPEQLKKEAKEHGLDVAQAEPESKGDKVVLTGSAAATGEAGKTAPASGNTAGVATTGEAGGRPRRRAAKRRALPRPGRPDRPRRRAARRRALPQSKTVSRPPPNPLNRSFIPPSPAIRCGRSPKPNMAMAMAANII